MSSTYLPYYFWYDGMNKIKAGKGYRNQKTGESEVLGVISGPCPECDGNIISIKICTSMKGFETTTEKVCDKCGLVIPGSFQILNKQTKEYKTKYYSTHDAWLIDNHPEGMPDEIDAYWENGVHLYGSRMGAQSDGTFRNITTKNKRLALAIRRLAKTNASKKMPMKDWRNKQYHEIADDYIHELGLNKLDAADVYYIIDNRNTLFKMDYKADDIILCLCMYFTKISNVQLYHPAHGILPRLFRLDKEKRDNIPQELDNIKTLYSLIVQKLNS